jgi:hypothetical protein
MAVKVVSFDVSDEPEDEFQPYTGPDPVRGYYHGVVRQCTMVQSGSGKDMLKIMAVIDDEGEFDGWPGWDNITLEAATKWKLAQFIRAVGAKPKGNTTVLMKFAVGKPIGILVGIGPDQDGRLRAEVKRFVKPTDDGVEDGAPVPARAKGSASAPAAVEDEDAEAPEPDDSGEAPEEDPWDEASLTALSVADLAAEAKHFEVWVKGQTRSQRVKAILDAQDADGGDGEPPF